MPAAVAVPAALAGLSLVTGNAQAKAADKNNENQQKGAVENASAAAQAAQSLYNGYASAHPAPFTGASVSKPAAMNTPNPAQNSVVQKIMQAAQPPQQPNVAAPKPLQPPPQAQPNIVNAILAGQV